MKNEGSIETISIYDLIQLLINYKRMHKREADEVKTLFRTNKDRLQQTTERIVEKIPCIILIYWDEQVTHIGKIIIAVLMQDMSKEYILLSVFKPHYFEFSA